MSKVWIIFEREYLQRVKKKSFILSTLLTPMIFPFFIFITVLLIDSDDQETRKIAVIDNNNLINDSISIGDNLLFKTNLDINSLQTSVLDGEIYGALIIPKMDIYDPNSLDFYSKNVPSSDFVRDIERVFEERIRNRKIDELQLEKSSLDKLRTNISMDTYSVEESVVSDSGELGVSKSSSGLAFGLGYFNGFLIYMFVFIYGSFILQSVLDEKTSKVVEVIVSSVKPIQLMMGKVLGVGAVAFTQISIWIVLVFSISTLTSIYFGIDTSNTSQIINSQEEIDQSKEMVAGFYEMFASIDIYKTIIVFLIYFTGGFFLYGAFFAAIGSAVDNLQDASQFTLPISLPIIASLMFMSVILENPESNASLFLSIFPFTSPILMMARLPFGVPDWQLFLSIILLILFVLFALWFAGRIYRVGILTSGSKITYKLLWKWFVMKNY
jgi:ABC-2 type transport system permease protein